MKIQKNKLEYIKFFRYVQNVENTNQYYLSGEQFCFLQGVKKEYYVDELSMKSNIENWLYDELFVFKAPLSEFKDLKELFYYINYLSNPDPENWLKKIANFTLTSERFVVDEFEETIGWAINEPLLNPNNIFLDIEFDKIKKSVRFLDSYNPLFLGCVIGVDYLFFNYNGYS